MNSRSLLLLAVLSASSVHAQAARRPPAQLAALQVKLGEVYDGEPAVRVTLPKLVLRGLKGQVFSLGATFRSEEGDWTPWVLTPAWTVPADPFTWKNALTHFLRMSALAEEDFANGAFIVRVAVFDAQGRELGFKEARFQLKASTQARGFRVEGEMERTPFAFEAPTREALRDQCRAWKEADIRLQGFVMRVGIKGGPIYGDVMWNTQRACEAVTAAAEPVH